MLRKKVQHYSSVTFPYDFYCSFNELIFIACNNNLIMWIVWNLLQLKGKSFHLKKKTKKEIVKKNVKRNWKISNSEKMNVMKKVFNNIEKQCL
jgi:hypothetical protein